MREGVGMCVRRDRKEPSKNVKGASSSGQRGKEQRGLSGGKVGWKARGAIAGRVLRARCRVGNGH